MPRIGTLHNSLPAKLDIWTYRGDTLVVIMNLTSRGVPLNMSDWDFSAYVRTTADDGIAARFDIEPIDLTLGKIRLMLSANQSARLLDDQMWDLQGEEITTGVVHTLVRGFIRSPADVTNDQIGSTRAALRGPQRATARVTRRTRSGR